jgi:hypothetical protein
MDQLLVRMDERLLKNGQRFGNSYHRVQRDLNTHRRVEPLINKDRVFVCYNCRKPGHISRHCDQGRRAQRSVRDEDTDEVCNSCVESTMVVARPCDSIASVRVVGNENHSELRHFDNNDEVEIHLKYLMEREKTSLRDLPSAVTKTRFGRLVKRMIGDTSSAAQRRHQVAMEIVEYVMETLESNVDIYDDTLKKVRDVEKSPKSWVRNEAVQARLSDNPIVVPEIAEDIEPGVVNMPLLTKEPTCVGSPNKSGRDESREDEEETSVCAGPPDKPQVHVKEDDIMTMSDQQRHDQGRESAEMYLEQFDYEPLSICNMM